MIDFTYRNSESSGKGRKVHPVKRRRIPADLVWKNIRKTLYMDDRLFVMSSLIDYFFRTEIRDFQKLTFLKMFLFLIFKCSIISVYSTLNSQVSDILFYLVIFLQLFILSVFKNCFQSFYFILHIIFCVECILGVSKVVLNRFNYSIDI